MFKETVDITDGLPMTRHDTRRCSIHAAITLLILLAIADPSSLLAQKEYTIWYFGKYAGLDFSGGAPVPLTDGRVWTEEGSAVFCDPTTGRLLFYTDGTFVWNRNHQLMPSGDRLKGHQFSVQPALIIPAPGDRSGTRYYIFTSDATDYFETPNEGINYSIVDMSADNGLGDVVEKNTSVLASATEKLTAIRHCNGRDFWILTHRWQDNAFHAFRLSPRGIIDTVVSYTGIANLSPVGYLRSSPDGRRLAAVMWNDGRYGGPRSIELFDFDNTTGIVSNPMRLADGDGFDYGACFSPDNSKLYISRARFVMPIETRTIKDTLFQYDLSNPSPVAILASKTNVGYADSLGAMLVGPDGRMYIARYGIDRMAVIDNPNAPGTQCGFRLNGLNLAGREGRWGLPNNIETYYLPPNPDCLPPKAMFVPSRLDICEGECIDFTDQSANGPAQWEWTFNGARTGTSTDRNPRAICYDDPGSFQVRLIASKMVGDELASDTTTMTVNVHPAPSADAGPDTTICARERVQLNASGGDVYAWAPAVGLSCVDCPSPVADPSVTTTYRVTVRNALGCVAVDSVTVFVRPAPVITATPSVTTICNGESVQLRAQGGSSYRWSPPDDLSCVDCPNPVASPSVTTTYIVTSSAPGTCDGRDTVMVEVVEALSADGGGDLRICAGDSVRIRASGSTGAYSWAPTVGLSCSDCLNPIASPSATTTYRLTIRSSGACQAVDSVTVSVDPRPTADAGPDRLVCSGDSVTLRAEGGSRYEWSPSDGLSCTDCQSPVARPAATSAYLVVAINDQGCRDTDIVTVRVDPSPRVARTHIDDDQAAAGTFLRVPIMLDDPLDAALVDSLLIELTYDDGMMLLREQTLSGTILEGWNIDSLQASPGKFRALLTAVPFTFMKGTGALIDLGFRVYLRSTTRSCIEYRITIPGNFCTTVLTDPGCVTLDPICGADLRFITGTTEDYALEEGRPNPFNPTTEIEFTLGLDGPTRLTIHDATGREVGVLVDMDLPAGRYAVRWDGSGYGSGVYYCRLSSGTWTQSRPLMLVK